MALSREDILNKQDFIIKKIDVPLWGEIYIRSMSVDDAEELDSKLKDNSLRLAMLAVASICDEKGNLLFTKDDVDKLGKKSSAAIVAIGKAVNELNSLNNDAVDTLEKN